MAFYTLKIKPKFNFLYNMTKLLENVINSKCVVMMFLFQGILGCRYDIGEYGHTFIFNILFRFVSEH